MGLVLGKAGVTAAFPPLWCCVMSRKSILNQDRFATASDDERRQILACEQTAHQCTFDVLAGCREVLPEPRATFAAIVGQMSALCRTIAEVPEPGPMGQAVVMMIADELKFWLDQKKVPVS